MKHFLMLLISALCMNAGLKAQEASEYHPTRIIVSFENKSDVYHAFWENMVSHEIQTVDQHSAVPEISAFMAETGLVSLKKLIAGEAFNHKIAQWDKKSVIHRLFIAEVPNPDDLLNTIEFLNAYPGIEHAEADYIIKGNANPVSVLEENPTSLMLTPNDPFYNNFQWGLNNTGQTIMGYTGTPGEDINAHGAWDITQGSEDIIVAVLDTGLSGNIPDMQGRVIAGYNFVSDNTVAADDHGHGTSVASIGFSTGNNGIMMSGVDWNAKVMPVKVLNQNNSGLTSYSVQGVIFAVDNGADVLNISVGTVDDVTAYRNAVQYAADNGVIVVASMMNNNTNTPYYPAAYGSVIAVGATDQNGDRAVPFTGGGDGSNYGDHIDLAAPGNLILGLLYNDNSNLGLSSGTSFSTPLVTGVVTLMLAANPNLTPAQVRQILHETARGSGSWNQFLGWGKLDATAAVQEAQGAPVNVEGQDGSETVQTYSLHQNYPNPFNPSTRISFKLPQAETVNLKVYDMLGREVANLLTNSTLSAGTHSVSFDASALSSGIYIYQIQAGGFSASRMMTLIK